MLHTIKQLLGIISFLYIAVSCTSSKMALEFKSLQQAEIFSISEDGVAIVLDGVINSSALDKFKTLFQENPTIKTVRIINCDGSIDDEINLQLAKFVYDKKLNTHLMENGIVASGGTDFFLSGIKRTRGANTKFGVHSWAGEDEKGKYITATNLPTNHEAHQPYINYYKSIGFSEKKASAFYFFTIKAADAENIYWMTDKEIDQYQMMTK